MATLPGFGITVPDPVPQYDYRNDPMVMNADYSTVPNLSGLDLTSLGMGGAYVPPTTSTTAAAAPAAPAKSAEDLYWEQQAAYAAQDRLNKQNALIEITRNYFQQNNMAEFVAGMEKYVRMGYSGDEIMVLLSNDKDYQAAWQKRFSGNALRKQNGLAELLPASYIELEQGYKQLYLKYGVPSTLFDSPDDFAALIGNDVSAVEVNDRLGMAARYLNYAGNAEVKEQLRSIYNMTDGEMMAYVLDPKRTQSYLESETRRNFNRANVGGAAATQGIQLASEFRDEIADLYSSQNTDNSFGDASQRFGVVAQESPLYQRLGALSGVEADANELVREQFDMTGGSAVTTKKRGLASQERARFSGSSGLGSTSLSAGQRAQ